MRKLRSVFAIVCLLVSFLFVAETAQARSLKVERVTFQVTLSDNQAYDLVGYLYCRGSCRNRTLQVLLHGATYDHAYWDGPTINGRSYSYARYMAEKNFAVLALDQLGSGESDHPDGDFLNLPDISYALHQVTTSLRTRHNPTRHAFDKIVLVGHSLGGLTSVFAEGVFGTTADGLVVTGFLVTPGGSTLSREALAPFLVAPYNIFPADARTGFIYHLPSADPDVIDFDNAFLSNVLSRGLTVSTLDFQLGDTSEEHISSIAGSIAEPVFIQLSDFDAIYPAGNAPDEASFYSGAASVTVRTLTDMGHGFNFHRENRVGWRQIERWIRQTL